MFYKIIIYLVFITSISGAQTRVSLISDVDDTLKISEVLHPISAAWRAADSKSYFLGMPELFQGILQQNPQTRISYVTAAPGFLVGKTHLKILQNFPSGKYYPRSQLSSKEHKLNTIRQIIKQDRPQLVLFFGDNAEGDPLVYKQIENEFAPSGIQFLTFIRINYSFSSQIEKTGDTQLFLSPPQSGQMNFVSPIEVSVLLYQRQLLSLEGARWMNDVLIPLLVQEPENLDRGVIAFPRFMDCRDFVWPLGVSKISWNIDLLKEKLHRRCSSQKMSPL